MTKKKKVKNVAQLAQYLPTVQKSPGSDIHHCIKWVWYICLKSQHSGARSSRNSRSSLATSELQASQDCVRAHLKKTKHKQAIVTYRKNNKAKTHCQQNRIICWDLKDLEGSAIFFLEEVAFLPTNLCLLSLFQKRKRQQSCLTTPPPLCT